MLYSIGKFAKEIGVTTTTLRNWHDSGELIPFKITNGGTRYYSEGQLNKYLNLEVETEKEIIIYSRVSNICQKDDLKNQIEFLKQYSNAKGYITHELTDIGSGLNFKRKNWNKLLDDVQSKKVSKIIIAHKDRFVRFGFDWFQSFCIKHGCDIEIVNNEKLSPQEEMVQDLISIIHVFSCRIYGLRKYKKELVDDKDVKDL